MITGEQMLKELIQLEPSRLDENTQKLFYTIMKVIDERDELQQENQTNKTIIEKQVKRIYELEHTLEEFKKWLEDEKYILAKSVSHIYEDSLGHSKFVNEDIFNELTKVLDKIKELEEGAK